MKVELSGPAGETVTLETRRGAKRAELVIYQSGHQVALALVDVSELRRMCRAFADDDAGSDPK